MAISSGCLYEYVWSLDITKWWAYLTLTFLCCCLLRGLSHVLLLHYRHCCPLWAVDVCPPSDAFFTCFAPPLQAFLPPVGRSWVSCQWWIFAPCGPLRAILPVRQPCPLWAFWWVVLSEGSHALCGACGGLSSPWGNFAPCGTLYTLMHITISALPLARPNCIGFNLQSCHLPDYFIGFSLQPCHLPDFIAWVSVYNAATVILFHWFQFTSPAICQTLFTLTAVQLARLYFTGFSTVLPLVRPYGISFSLQPCHWLDFVSLVSVCNPDACQTLFHGYSLQFAVLPLVRLYFIGFSLQSCHLPDLIYPGSVYNLLISALHCSSAIGQNILHQVQGVTWLARIYFIKSRVRPAHSYTIYMAKTRQYTIYMAKTRQRDTPEWLIPSSSWVALWSDARHNQRGEAAMPRHQRDCQTSGVSGRPRRQRYHRSTSRTPTLEALQRCGQNQPGWNSSWTSWGDQSEVPCECEIKFKKQQQREALPPCGPLVVVLPVRQLCPLCANAHYNCSPAACQTLSL